MQTAQLGMEMYGAAFDAIAERLRLEDTPAQTFDPHKLAAGHFRLFRNDAIGEISGMPTLKGAFDATSANVGVASLRDKNTLVEAVPVNVAHALRLAGTYERVLWLQEGSKRLGGAAAKLRFTVERDAYGTLIALSMGVGNAATCASKVAAAQAGAEQEVEIAAVAAGC